MARADRPNRKLTFRSPLETLEVRQVPAVVFAPLPTQVVEFENPRMIVSQSAESAEVVLRRNFTAGDLALRFRTLEGPGAGLNHLPVDTVVVIPDGETSASVQVPLNPGAPNPGEVEVGLQVLTDQPGISLPGARHRPGQPTVSPVLVIADRTDVTPPHIVSTQLTREGVVLTFSEPMDPIRAGDRRNYILQGGPPESVVSKAYRFLTFSSSEPAPLVPLRAARYDPTTHSVTLIPRQPLSPSGEYEVSSPKLNMIQRRHLRGGRDPRGALTDLAGNTLAVQHRTDGTFTKLPVGPREVRLPGSNS
jgi:hypothetical protein